jgi:predicted nucleotidyltransferase component of viral defense system
MILQSEILKIAEEQGVLPDTIDKNWVLGHFLAELFRTSWAQNLLIFKGGTCLKKCYFPDYRFSEDLDFTLNRSDFQITSNLLQTILDTITEQVGILFSKVKIEPIIFNNMQVGYSSHIRFWGVNHKKNQQPTSPERWHTEIKFEVISYELMVNEPTICPLYSNYSDRKLFEGITIPCYQISEVVAEKFRALLQRSYPAPRDYYDLWNLLRQKGFIDLEGIVSTFLSKASYKNIHFNQVDDFFDPEQVRKVKQAWNNSLKGHLKEKDLPDFDTVLIELKEICDKIPWKGNEIDIIQKPL